MATALGAHMHAVKGLIRVLIVAVISAACSVTSTTPTTMPTPTPGSSATLPEDPAMRGPHAVGFMKRTYQRASSFDSTVREHETYIWYPASLASGHLPAPEGNVDAPAAVSGAPYPLLVWSHGLTSDPPRSIVLIAHLVSHGFVVVGPMHISDCQPPSLASETGSARVCPTSLAVQRVDQERPQDLLKVLDAVLGDEQVARMIDRERVAAGGYSSGGSTALQVAGQDQRIKAVLALAPATRGPVPGVKVPTMLVAGTLDVRVPIATVEARFGELLSWVPKWLVTLRRAGHGHFQNAGCVDQALTRGTCAEAMPVAQAHVVINRWSAAFLLRYLAGNTAYDGYLDPSRHGHPDVSVASSRG